MSEFSARDNQARLELGVEAGLDTVEALLLESVQDSRGLVSDLTSHLAKAGGKRLRPMLTLISGQLGAPHRALSDEVVKAAAAVELTHLASLYHDDVMDSAPSRRGVESAQRVWGNNRAILAGDVLFARASTLVAALGPETVAHHARMFERLCIGQLNETFGPAEEDDPVGFYLQVLADKTGSLVAAAAHFGAFHSGAGRDVAAMVESFGEKVGVAFQLADDVIDIASSGEITGKTPGTDLREGVDTMPVLLLKRDLAAGTIDDEGRAILTALDQDLSSDEALSAVVEALREHPVLTQTLELARQWADDAVAALAPLPNSEAKDALEAFALMMVDRAA